MKKIQCFCCHKCIQSFSVEPEFYCGSCVKKKEIHNSSNNTDPIKWYSVISNEISFDHTILSKLILKLNKFTRANKDKEFQMRKLRIADITLLIEKLKEKKQNKINLKNSIVARQNSIKCDLTDVINKTLFTKSRINDLSKNQEDLIHKILTIQSYLNQLQCLFVKEIFRLFPIVISKYKPHTICDVPFHIDLSDSSVLESNDSTASAIIFLTILVTSITFILDICYSSMDIKQFAYKTICLKSTPLQRDEIMCVYKFLVRLVHHITQSTLFRIDMKKNQLTKIMSTDSLSMIIIDELNAENYPLKKLVILEENLNAALLMTGISNPYTFHLPNMFQNEFINEYSFCSKISPLKQLDDDMMDFEELSSIIPLDELPSIYQQQTIIDNIGIKDWLFRMKNGFS